MKISDQISMVQDVVDLLDIISTDIIICAIVFLVAYVICRIICEAILKKFSELPIGIHNAAEVKELFMKNGLLCNEINEGSFSVIIPKAPKISPIIFESVDRLDGSYNLRVNTDRDDIKKSFMYILYMMLLAYNEYVFRPEKGENVDGLEEMEEKSYRLYKSKSMKHGVSLLVFGVVLAVVSFGVAEYYNDYFSQPGVLIQQGIEDTFDVNLNGISDSSFDDYSYDQEESDDTDQEEKGAPAKKSESSNDFDATSQPKTTDVTSNVDEVIPTDLYTADTKIDYYELGGRYEGGGYEDCSINMYTSFDDQYVGNIDIEYNGKTYSGQLEEVRTNVYKARCDDGSFLVLAVYTYDNLGVDDPAFALYINGEYVQYYALSEHYYS